MCMTKNEVELMTNKRGFSLVEIFLMNLESITIRVFADGKELTNIIGNLNYSGHAWGSCDEWKKGCEPENQKYNASFAVLFPNSNNLFPGETFYDEEDYFERCDNEIKSAFHQYKGFTCNPKKVTKDFFKQ